MRLRRTKNLVLLLIGTILLITYGSSSVTAIADPAALASSAYLPLVVGASSAPTPTPPSNDWLSYLNTLRGLANLPAVSENATSSDGAFKHSRYMVKNDVIAHSEDSGKPFYTTEGNIAAGKSNVMVSSTTNTTDMDALDMWMTGPFHGVGLLDTRLVQSGYGAYREEDGGWEMAGTLDVLSGRASKPPTSVVFPIMWPADGKTSWLTTYDGNESPDPLTSCAGYTAPSGAPIYLQLGTGSITPIVSSATLTKNGASLPICTYSEATYTNPESSQQSLGRNVLGSRDAVIIIPKNPLEAGSYSVSITVNGTNHSWSFTITNTAPNRLHPASNQADGATPPLP